MNKHNIDIRNISRLFWIASYMGWMCSEEYELFMDFVKDKARDEGWVISGKFNPTVDMGNISHLFGIFAFSKTQDNSDEYGIYRTFCDVNSTLPEPPDYFNRLSLFDRDVEVARVLRYTIIR